MKIAPTEVGGLRIDCEDPGDWQILRAIPHDARSCDQPLAERLGQLMGQGECADDWRDYVIPELNDGFSAAIDHVSKAIASAEMDAAGATGSLWIARDDSFHWFSALNQARLALEARYQFGADDDGHNPADTQAVPRAARLRSRFYCAIQSILLERGLG